MSGIGAFGLGGSILVHGGMVWQHSSSTVAPAASSVEPGLKATDQLVLECAEDHSEAPVTKEDSDRADDKVVAHSNPNCLE